MHIDPNIKHACNISGVSGGGGGEGGGVLEHPIGPETEPASFKNEEHGQCFGDVP